MFFSVSTLSAKTIQRIRLYRYLITQSKTSLFAMELKRKISVSYNTAWSIKKNHACHERTR